MEFVHSFYSRVKRNRSKFMYKLVEPRRRPAVTRPRHFATAVQYKLYAQINILGNAIACNLIE